MLSVLGHKNLNELNINNIIIGLVIGKLEFVEFATDMFTRDNLLESFKQSVNLYNAKVDKLVNAEQVNGFCSKATHADFMIITELFEYYEDETVHVISLKYKYDHMVATIILPKIMNINEYIDNLTLDSYHNLIGKMKKSKVKLYFPKFEMECEVNLSSLLISLGIRQAFNNHTDFSSMIKQNDVKIEKVLHKSFIKIDEEGIEAVAFTAVVHVKKSKPTTFNFPHSSKITPFPELSFDSVLDVFPLGRENSCFIISMSMLLSTVSVILLYHSIHSFEKLANIRRNINDKIP
eukprot:jgi/Orpsp1_1/1177228/evm.model.c7180000060621.1